MTVQKRHISNPNAKTEVWSNLKLILAPDSKAAMRKAVAVGNGEAGDCRGSLTLDGWPATTIFLGIEDIGLVHDEIADGVEILWRTRRCNRRSAEGIPRPEAELLSRLERELADT